MKFNIGDKVRFESVNPNKKGKIYQGTIKDEGYESNGVERVHGYWVDANNGSGNWTWVEDKDLQQAA